MRTTTRVLATAAALLLLVPLTTTAGAEPARPAQLIAARAAGDIIPGQYLVTLRKGADPQTVLDRIGVKPLFVYTAAFFGFAVKLTLLQKTVLENLKVAESIEADATVAVDTKPGQQQDRAVGSWGLDRINQRDLPLNGSYTPAHDGSTVTAYIIDTGIDYGHSEFGGRATFGYDAINDGRRGADCNGHGTHVAGTVGGATYGVAKRVRLVSVRVLGCDGRGTWSGVVAGFDWVAANAVKPAVANASLGGTPVSSTVDNASNSVANKGVFITVAGGNDTADACNYSPARAASVFTIGATTSADGYAAYSNRGQCVQLLAPGTDITSAWPGGTTRTISGTSMATPHVTGVAALFKQAYGDQPQGNIQNWLWSNASLNKIGGMPASTPNYLLYTGGL